jgi:hypothetical protein
MNSLHSRVVVVLLAGIVCARADGGAPTSKDDEAVQREIARLDSVKPRASNRPLNNFSVSYQLGLNIRTTFKGFGAFRANNPGPATHPANHEYDDGYNRVDAQGNDHTDQGFPNTTTFWGYQNSSQWNHANNTVEMHSAASQPFADVSNDDPQNGFQLSYERVLGECDRFYWGFESAFGFTKLDVNESKTVTSPVVVATDAYAIPPDPLFGGFSIPAAPYNGPFSGDLGTSLLSDIPIRSVAANGQFATVMSTRHLDANVWRVHLGPKLHVPVKDRLEFEFSGGLGIAVVDSTFGFNEQIFLPPSVSLPDGSLSAVRHGSSDNQGALVGGYLGGNIAYWVWRDAKIFAGVQWEDLGTYRHEIGTHVAEVDYTDALSVLLGFNVGF